MSCSVLQHVAVRFSALHRHDEVNCVRYKSSVAACCSVSLCIAVCCSDTQIVVLCSLKNVLQWNKITKLTSTGRPFSKKKKRFPNSTFHRTGTHTLQIIKSVITLYRCRGKMYFFVSRRSIKKRRIRFVKVSNLWYSRTAVIHIREIKNQKYFYKQNNINACRVVTPELRAATVRFLFF